MPLDHNVKFKLNGKRLFPTSSVKYLGVFLDEHLYWNKELDHVFAKLHQGIDILSKLIHSKILNILNLFITLVRSYLQYDAQL